MSTVSHEPQSTQPVSCCAELEKANQTIRELEERIKAISLRGRLEAFAEEWDRPEMDIYNNYDEELAKLKVRRGDTR